MTITPTRVLTSSKVVAPGPMGVVQSLQLLVEQVADAVKVCAAEQAARDRIHAWQSIQVEEIRSRAAMLSQTIDRVFDERQSTISPLLDHVATAVATRDNQQLAVLLDQLQQVLRNDAIREIADIAALQLRVEDPETVYQL